MVLNGPRADAPSAARKHSLAPVVIVFLSLLLGACGGRSDDSEANAGHSAALTAPIRPAAALAAAQDLIRQQVAMHNATRRALFGLNADGSANPHSLSGIDWSPSHDSARLELLDLARNRVVLRSNWRYASNNANYNTSPSPGRGVPLAVTGEMPDSEARYAAIGGNPIANPGNAAMDSFMQNTIAWLTRRRGVSGYRFVTAHLPSEGTHWFPHERRVNRWLSTHYPNAAINGDSEASRATQQDRCDGDRLSSCLADADLLIIGREQAPDRPYDAADSYPAAYNSATVLDAIAEAQLRGVPVLYLHHSYDNNDLSRRLLLRLGLQAQDNYWDQEGLRAFDPAAEPAQPPSTAALAGLLQHLEQETFSTDWSGCTNPWGRTECDQDATLNREFLRPARAMRNRLRALDESGTAVFSEPGYALEKLLIRLGDHYRQSVAYPLDKLKHRQEFFQAMFSDMAAYMHRSDNVVAQNLGNFSALLRAVPAISQTHSVTPPPAGTLDHLTGLYVMPGRRVTLLRTDPGPGKLRFGINMLRDTTRPFDIYDRPTLLASPRPTLVQGVPVSINHPFGGPLLLFVEGSADAAPVQIQIRGVARHPVLARPGDAAQQAAFQAELASTNTDWVGLSSAFLTVHSRRDQFNASLATYAGNLPLLLKDIQNYLISDTYSLAGFHSGTDFEMAASVRAFCDASGWDCSGPQHRRDSVQHVIVDKYALCGSGCAGNPYDQDWPLDPLGWGESHEIGHGLQVDKLMIYGSQSAEVSNNIFPVHKQIRFNQTRHPARPLLRGDGGTGPLFALLKEAQRQADPAAFAKARLWSDTAYAANHAERLHFYRQLVELARHHNPATFTDGWELYPLLYMLQRNLTGSQAGAQNGSASAALREVFGSYAELPLRLEGNDFMLIGSSRIVGRDLRSHFDLWGVDYSAAASRQVASFGYASAGRLLFPMADVNASGSGVGLPVFMNKNSIYPSGY